MNCNGFLTIHELAHLAGVRESTILWWMHSGDAPDSEHVHGRTVFLAEAVDVWLAHPSPSRAVARPNNSISSSTSLASSRVFADAGEAA